VRTVETSASARRKFVGQFLERRDLRSQYHIAREGARGFVAQMSAEELANGIDSDPAEFAELGNLAAAASFIRRCSCICAPANIFIAPWN
jgi:hypothetical protein